MNKVIQPMTLHFNRISKDQIEKSIIDNSGNIIRKEILYVDSISNLEEYIKDWVKQTKGIPVYNITKVSNNFGLDL